MTAYGETDLLPKAKKMGVQWYISKPFDLTELRCLVKALVIGDAVQDKRKEISLAKEPA